MRPLLVNSEGTVCLHKLHDGEATFSLVSNIARNRLKKVSPHQVSAFSLAAVSGSINTFNFKRMFNVVLCLFRFDTIVVISALIATIINSAMKSGKWHSIYLSGFRAVAMWFLWCSEWLLDGCFGLQSGCVVVATMMFRVAAAVL